MLVVATVGLYGHDGMWLNLSRDYFLVCNHGHCETREYGVFALSLSKNPVNCIVLQEFVWTVSRQKHCSVEH